MLQTARAMPAQLCLHRRRDEQIRFAPDRSDSRACDHRCAARSADGGGSARQRRRERSEAARAADREAEVHDRQAPSPAVRSILGARRDPRAARAAAFRAAGGCLRGRGDGAAGGSRGGEREDQGAGLRAPQAGAPSAARASAARARRLSIAVGVPVLRRGLAQARRGRDRDAGARSAPVESDPAYAREGIDLDVSTLADWVGTCAATLMPLVLLIRAYVFAAERIHADETTVPVQAKGQCRTGRLWTYVRDDQPFGGLDPPAAAFFYSPDRSGRHPEEHLASYAGLMQADAYSGFNRLYGASRKGGSIVEASCWAHARRKFFDLARINKAPIAIEAVERIDALFAIEREINGAAPHECERVRHERSRPLVVALETWLREQRRKLSARNQIAKAIQYSLNRWIALTRFLDDGRLCMSNNAAERALRGIAVGRHNWTFAGSDEGGRRAAAIYTLVETAKLNDIDPQAWLADVLARLQDHPAKRIDELLPWNWKRARLQQAAA